MKLKDWDKIEYHFHEALKLDAAERGKYLDRFYPDDDARRGEIESLLESSESDEFFDTPIFEAGIGLMGKAADPRLTGRMIGNYEIGEKIGSGGMGDVYLAEDQKLNRKVALKFLSDAFAGDYGAKRRLMKEARAAAMLDHPNICAVYDFEEVGELSFIVMQYFEGETLAEMIKGPGVGRKEVLPIAEQILSALAFAHSHGIVHRDVKSGNIMVNSSGQVKVLDFGLAKIIRSQNSLEEREATLTNSSLGGLIVGTVAYMSPEQLRGEKSDFRSDIFSLGIVLYEIIAGSRPFVRKSNAEVISAILTAPPEPISLPSDLPPKMESIVHKCLAKEKNNRFQSVNEIILAMQSPIETNKKSKTSKIKTYALLFLVFVFAALGVNHYLRKNKINNLAVLPIVNDTADSNLRFIADGLTEDLIDKINRSSNLSVKAYTIIANLKNNQLNGIEAGHKLNADAIVESKLVEREGQVFIQYSLIDVGNGSAYWSEETVFTTADTLKIEDKISERIIFTFDANTGNSKDQTQLEETSNPEAFRYYMLGRYYWRNRNKNNIVKAVDAFSTAIKLDPLYVKAYSGLANVYVVQSGPSYGSLPTDEVMPKARAAAKEALLLNNNSAEAHAAMAVVLGKYDYNWKDAESEFRKSIELNPDDAQSRYWYSEFLATTGRTDEALKEAARAHELDPFSPVIKANIGRILYFGRRFDEALKFFDESSKLEAAESKSKYMMGLIYLQKKMYKAALEIFQKLNTENDKALTAAVTGYTYAKTGRRAEALKILSDMQKNNGGESFVPPQEKAIVLIGLGDRQKAIEYIRQAKEQHLSTLSSINVEPLYDDLRAEPEFSGIVRSMNLN